VAQLLDGLSGSASIGQQDYAKAGSEPAPA
jgi:hypothetical protein